ncbi:MAG: cytoplasmic protein [Proteobacteria bacterium]|nr:cytoplasmic protein [Pseudomonadota bacterium]
MNSGIDFTVDHTNLYREEAITDLKVASIRVLIPVTIDGSSDTSRKSVYVGHTQLMSPQGPIPIQAQLKADNLDAAIKEFPSAMEEATEQVLENLRKLQREHESKKDSRIISPR